MVTGRPQAVMVHVIVGAANALAGIINASRVGVPMLFTAGRNPITEAGMPGARNRPIHWAQESFDQAGLAREFVKWDYELRNFVQLETVVDRALAIAAAEPQGPVYLTLPREVLSEAQESFEYSPTSRAPKPQATVAAPDAIAEAATLLAAAAAYPRQSRRTRSRGRRLARRAGRGARRAGGRSIPYAHELPARPRAARRLRRHALPRRRRRHRGRRVGRPVVPLAEDAAPG